MGAIKILRSLIDDSKKKLEAFWKLPGGYQNSIEICGTCNKNGKLSGRYLAATKIAWEIVGLEQNLEDYWKLPDSFQNKLKFCGSYKYPRKLHVS